MKILQLSKSADPIGGAELAMLFLTEELRRRGHDVFVFGTSPDREVDEPHRRVVRRANFPREALFHDRALEAELARVLERFEPDVVHVHNSWGLPLTVDRLLVDHPAPLVHTLHDWSTFCPNSWCVVGDGSPCSGGAGVKCFRNDCEKNAPVHPDLVLMTQLRHELLASGVDVAVAPSEALAAMARSHGFQDARHVPNFVETESLASAAKDERETDRLLFVGRVQPEKGALVLVEALIRALEERSSLRLTILGSGTDLDAVRARALEAGITEAIELHGHVPRERIASFYSEATALVLPSTWSENSPLTAHEAMASGLPILASRIGGLPELVRDGETGWLFEPRDVEGLAARMVSFCSLSTAERSEYSRRARALAGEHDLERTMSGYLGAYEDAVASSRGARSQAGSYSDERAELLGALAHRLVESEERRDDLERLVSEMVDANGLKSLLTPEGLLYVARRGAKSLGLPKFFRGS